MAYDELTKNRRGTTLVLTPQGFVATEVWRVTLLGSAEADLTFDIMTDGDMPIYGDEHPVINPTANPGFAAIYLTEINIVPLGANKADVTLQYRRPDFVDAQPVDDTGDGVIEVGASVVTKRTEKDAIGAQITVAHDFTATQPERGVITQGGEVEMQVPQSVLRLERHETTNPQSKQSHVGTVNSGAIWGYAAWSLLCTGITGRSEDGGASYLVTYEFQYNPETWFQVAVFIDPQTGRPPPGLVAGVGVKLEQVQPASDFTLLGISF